MALDTRIALAGQPVDIAGSIGKGLQLRDMQQQSQMNQMKMDQARQAQDRQMRLSQLLSGQQYESDDARIGAMRNAGYLAEAADYEKSILDAQKARAEIGNTQSLAKDRDFQNKVRRLNAASGVVASAAANPNVTTNDVLASIRQQVQLGMLDPQEGAEMARGLPPPEQLRPWLMQKGLEIADAKTRIDMLTPKVDLRDTGSQIVPVRMNQMTGEVVTGPPVAQKTMTPGERDASARGWQTVRQGQTSFVPVEGVGLFVGDKITGQVRPVTGPGGEPIKSQSSEVRKELMSIRQQGSIIDGAIQAAKNTPSAFSFSRGVSGKLPFGESLAGRGETAEETQARGYVFNNVSRVINERAGAAQSAQELARLQSFLPADTDNATQIVNKLEGFKKYLADLESGTRGDAKPANAPPPAASIQIGTVQDGYIYQGGDPSKPASWKKATK